MTQSVYKKSPITDPSDGPASNTNNVHMNECAIGRTRLWAKKTGTIFR